MRVGLTGGIAAGKSTVADQLRELGAVVIDSDRLAREVVARGTPGLERVAAEFGPDVLTPEGDLDRPAMGAIVFADPEARARLEGIIHPLIYERIAELEGGVEPGTLVVHDIPLLAENGRQGDFAAVIVVDVDEDEQVRRMVEDRGWTEEQARSRMSAQASREQRLAIATYVVENGGSHEALAARVREVYDDLRRSD